MKIALFQPHTIEPQYVHYIYYNLTARVLQTSNNIPTQIIIIRMTTYTCSIYIHLRMALEPLLYHLIHQISKYPCEKTQKVLKKWALTITMILACEKVLRSAQSVEREKEGELVTTSLDFEFCFQFPCGSPSTELSNFRQSARSGNEREYKQTFKGTWKHAPRVMTSLLMSSPPISISHRFFRCRYSNSRDVVASSPSFPRPAARTPRRACSQATIIPVLLTV